MSIVSDYVSIWYPTTSPKYNQKVNELTKLIKPDEPISVNKLYLFGKTIYDAKGVQQLTNGILYNIKNQLFIPFFIAVLSSIVLLGMVNGSSIYKIGILFVVFGIIGGLILYWEPSFDLSFKPAVQNAAKESSKQIFEMDPLFVNQVDTVDNQSSSANC